MIIAKNDLESLQIKGTTQAQLRRGNFVLDKIRSEVPTDLY